MFVTSTHNRQKLLLKMLSLFLCYFFFVYLFSWFRSNRRNTNKTCLKIHSEIWRLWSLLKKFLFPVFIWRHHLISQEKRREKRENLWLSCSCFYRKLWISLIFERNALSTFWDIDSSIWDLHCNTTQYNTTANQMMIVAFAIWLFDYFSN